jgi:hypothetical protein
MTSIPASICALMAGLLVLAGPVHAQSNEEAQRLVDEYAAFESVCDVAKLRYHIMDRVVGRVRKAALAQFDLWTSEEKRKFERDCQRGQRSASRRITRVERNIDVSSFGTAERGTKLFFDRLDEREAVIGGSCVVVVVRSGGDWMFVDGNCDSADTSPASTSK